MNISGIVWSIMKILRRKIDLSQRSISIFSLISKTNIMSDFVYTADYNKDTMTYTAECRKECLIVGSLMAIPSMGLMYLNVESEWHRQGIATTLVREYLQWIQKSTRLKQVVFPFEIENIPALNLYIKLDFEIVEDEEQEDSILGNRLARYSFVR